MAGKQTRLIDQVKDFLGKEYLSLEQLYKYLHSHPELSSQEKNTSERIAEELRKCGFEVAARIGGYGVVGVFKNGTGPTIMLRTEMDALPIEEKTGLDYASKVRAVDADGKEVPVMHACGHDIHMTVFIGTARLLTHLKNHWKGTLVMVGQPAEEIGKGAKAMIADKLFTRFHHPDYIMALHVSSYVPCGKVAYFEEDSATANVDTVEIIIRGVGSHAAYPDAAKDTITIAAQVVLALQTIVKREIYPLHSAIITVGSIHGGTSSNIIPDEVRLQLDFRYFHHYLRNKIIQAIKRITRGIALASGVSENLMPIVVVNEESSVPGVYNDTELTRRIAKALEVVLGKENVIESPPVLNSDDFGQYCKVEPRIPLTFFSLGARDPTLHGEDKKVDKPLPGLHSPYFAPLPEPTIKTGIKAMTAAILELMKKNGRER